MRILVTGARGFIGAAIVRRALSCGQEVVALDTAAGKRELPAEVEFILGDINAPVDWASKLRGVDALIHTAAIHRVDEVMVNPVKAISVNLHGTRAVLNAAAKAGVGRFVYLSTAKVYGVSLGFRSEESELPTPLEPYGLSKALSEQYCRVYQESTGMRCVSIRPFSVYGPGQDLDTGYIGQLIQSLRDNSPAVLSGTPEHIRDFVYIEDVVQLCMAAATRDLTFDVINAGSGRATSLSDLVKMFQKSAGRAIMVRYKEPSPGTIARSLAAIERMSLTLSSQPTNLADGLAQTLSWFLGDSGVA